MFSNDKKKKFYLLLWKIGSNTKSKYGFGISNDTFGWYSLQLIVLLKPDFNYCNCFALSWADKVTTDIFVPVIANDVAFASLDKTHFSDPVKVKLILQLIKELQEFSKNYLNILK